MELTPFTVAVSYTHLMCIRDSRLHHAQLTVHGSDGHQNGVRAQQFFQVGKVHRAVLPDVHKVCLLYTSSLHARLRQLSSEDHQSVSGFCEGSPLPLSLIHISPSFFLYQLENRLGGVGTHRPLSWLYYSELFLVSQG